MIFKKKNDKKIPRNKKTRKSSRFFYRFIVHRFKAPSSKYLYIYANAANNNNNRQKYIIYIYIY